MLKTRFKGIERDWGWMRKFLYFQSGEMMRHLYEGDQGFGWFAAEREHLLQHTGEILDEIPKYSDSITEDENAWIDTLKRFRADLKGFDAELYECLDDSEKRGYAEEMGLRYATSLKRLFGDDYNKEDLRFLEPRFTEYETRYVVKETPKGTIRVPIRIPKGMVKED